MLVPEIEKFHMSITPSKALLSPLHRKRLNPMRVNIVGAKQLPTVNESKYLPVYVSMQFFDGYTVRTSQLPHGHTLKWKHKHVFLLGNLDPVWLKERISKNTLKL